VDTSIKNIRTVLGKVLHFCGDGLCAFALILEEKSSGKFGNIVITKISNLFWKLGQWFYNQADKYAWSYLKTDKPVKKYG
tara:strand:+ start:1077 stop:1316 length:240 start_codon:yes stop_codon:yes gene_type:complete